MQNMFDLRELVLNLLFQPGKGETGLNLGQACKQVGKNMLCVADVGYGILAPDGLLNHRHQVVGNFGRGRQHGGNLPLPGIALQNLGNTQKTFCICH